MDLNWCAQLLRYLSRVILTACTCKYTIRIFYRSLVIIFDVGIDWKCTSPLLLWSIFRYLHMMKHSYPVFSLDPIRGNKIRSLVLNVELLCVNLGNIKK